MKEKKINEIDYINQIEEEILDYKIKEDKIIISTEKYDYHVNYTYKNEEEVFKKYQSNCVNKLDKLRDELKQNNIDKKLFKKALIFVIGLGLFIALISGLSLGLIFCIPSLVIAIQVTHILKQLKKENKGKNKNYNKISNSLIEKNNQLIENEKKISEKFPMNIEEVCEEDLSFFDITDIPEEYLEFDMEELEEDELDYAYIKNLDFDDLNLSDEFLDEIIDYCTEDEKTENSGFVKKIGTKK